MKKTKHKTKNCNCKCHTNFVTMGLVLIALLLLQATAFGVFTAADWNAGFSLLDVNQTVSDIGDGVALISAPPLFALESIDAFYQEAAKEMAYLLDFSDVFYSAPDYSPDIAGVSVVQPAEFESEMAPTPELVDREYMEQFEEGNLETLIWY